METAATRGEKLFPKASKESIHTDTVREVMTSNLEWIRASDNCITAANKMRDRNVGILPVTTQLPTPSSTGVSELCGVITDRDLVTRLLGQGAKPSETAVASMMTEPPIAFVFEDANLRDAERAMIEHQVRRLLVKRSVNVVGVLSVDDLAMTGSLRRAGEILRAQSKEPMRREEAGTFQRPPIVSSAAPSMMSCVAVPELRPSLHSVSSAMHPHVEWLLDSDSICDAAVKMTKHAIGFLPVCSLTDTKPTLCGVVTDRDLVVRGISCHLAPDTTAVRELMTSDVVYCNTDDNLAEAQRLMMARSVRRLPVVERHSRELAGIISVDDIARSTSSTRAAEILCWVAEPATFSESLEG